MNKHLDKLKLLRQALKDPKVKKLAKEFFYYVCTDPDLLQFRMGTNLYLEFNRVEYPQLFEHCKDIYYNINSNNKEFIETLLTINPDYFIWDTIRVRDYKYKYIEDMVNSYGYTLLDNYLLDGYNENDSLELIKECIFEQTNGLY